MDRDASETAVRSSFLAHPAAVAFWMILCVAAVLISHIILAVFSGFIFAVTLCSLIWGRLSLRGVRYDISISESGVFPGQSVTLTRTVSNGKFLPLLWLELLEPCNPDGPVAPDGNFIVPDPDAGDADPGDSWRSLYSFSLLKWYQSLTYSDTWLAKRRGIHRINEVTIRSGDGFGLSAAKCRLTPGTLRQIAVYPRLTDVSVDEILNDMWDTRSRATGYLEDVTLMRSVRDYTTGDPARHINRRLLARGQGLKVNQYPVVTPGNVLFVLDAASFHGQEGRHFEYVLSILASLIVGLSRRGVNVGLIAQRSGHFPQTYVAPSNSETELIRMLELLSAAAPDDPPLEDPIGSASTESLGLVYYIAYSENAASSLQSLARFPPHKTRLMALVAQMYEGSRDLRTVAISQFGRVS